MGTGNILLGVRLRWTSIPSMGEPLWLVCDFSFVTHQKPLNGTSFMKIELVVRNLDKTPPTQYKSYNLQFDRPSPKTKSILPNLMFLVFWANQA